MKYLTILTAATALALAGCGANESSNQETDRSSSNAVESAGTDSGPAPAANQAPAAGGLREDPNRSEAGGTGFASGTGGQGTSTDPMPTTSTDIRGSGPGTADVNP